MPNCIIHRDGNIIHFINDCIVSERPNQKNKDYFGSNKKLHSFKAEGCKFKWVKSDEVFDPSKSIDDYTEVSYIGFIPVCSEEEVNSAIKATIKTTYSLEDEIKILRQKISGTLLDKEWEEYNTFVESLISEGKEIKEDK